MNSTENPFHRYRDILLNQDYSAAQTLPRCAESPVLLVRGWIAREAQLPLGLNVRSWYYVQYDETHQNIKSPSSRQACATAQQHGSKR